MYKLCESSGYTYGMRVYLGKQRNMTSTDAAPTHGMVLELFRKVKEFDIKYSWMIISPH
jgi:hypothetical protein